MRFPLELGNLTKNGYVFYNTDFDKFLEENIKEDYITKQDMKCFLALMNIYDMRLLKYFIEKFEGEGNISKACFNCSNSSKFFAYRMLFYHKQDAKYIRVGEDEIEDTFLQFKDCINKEELEEFMKKSKVENINQLIVYAAYTLSKGYKLQIYSNYIESIIRREDLQMYGNMTRNGFKFTNREYDAFIDKSLTDQPIFIKEGVKCTLAFKMINDKDSFRKFIKEHFSVRPFNNTVVNAVYNYLGTNENVTDIYRFNQRQKGRIKWREREITEIFNLIEGSDTEDRKLLEEYVQSQNIETVDQLVLNISKNWRHVKDMYIATSNFLISFALAELTYIKSGKGI